MKRLKLFLGKHLKLQGCAPFLPVRLWWDCAPGQPVHTTEHKHVVTRELNMGTCAGGIDLTLGLC